MRSPSTSGSKFLWLLRKEGRELAMSRSWWVLLFAMGPLTGMSFIGSVRTYGEVSGVNGTAAGVGPALAPLIGVWAPTFSACELAAVFLLPFVAIGLAAGDRQSGALRLELQQQATGSAARMLAKAGVLLGGWLVAMLPPLSALLLWKAYGGTLYAPEMATLICGHLLNGALTISLAVAMASFTQHPSTAAILTLSFTIGTWLLSFMGAIQGGAWESAAGYTPSAMVGQFQHGLVRLDVVLIAITAMLAGFALAAVWSRIGFRVLQRVAESISIGALAAAVIFACTLPTPSWDLSESRGNSFSAPDERVLRDIKAQLTIEVHLAPEDPRRVDLEKRALSRLRRVIPNLRVRYASASSIGLFEQSSLGYGEIWYDVAGRRAMSRATTAEGVLETIYSVAGVKPPAEPEDGEEAYRGDPLAVQPSGAGTIFYALWPGIFLASGMILRRRLQ